MPLSPKHGKTSQLASQQIFIRGDFPSTILKYQKPVIAWSKTSKHIGGSLPGFMCKFGQGDFLSGRKPVIAWSKTKQLRSQPSNLNRQWTFLLYASSYCQQTDALLLKSFLALSPVIVFFVCEQYIYKVTDSLIRLSVHIVYMFSKHYERTSHTHQCLHQHVQNSCNTKSTALHGPCNLP